MQAIEKGSTLAANFYNSDVPQSEYTSYENLRGYGWVQIVAAPQQSRSATDEDADEADEAMYRDLQIRREARFNIYFRWVHMEVKGDYPATEALYDFVLNNRAIFALQSEGPDYCAREDLDLESDQLVLLKHWSDVVFLQWLNFHGGDMDKMRGLRYIFQMDIHGGDAKSIVLNALNSSGLELRPWPLNGAFNDDDKKPASLRIGSQGYYAILATVNGVGPAYFLAQHREQLGNLCISAITVFKRDVHTIDQTLNLCFHVEPVMESAS